MNKIFKVVTFVPRRLWNYTKSINTLLEAPTGIKEGASSTLEYWSKLTGATTGVAGIGKGAADALEAYACQDGVCFVISCIGVGADTLQVLASFVPGPNVTSIVTLPVSVGCKTFVWACKNKTLPWKGGC